MINPDRVWEHYRSLKKSFYQQYGTYGAYQGNDGDFNSVWLTLARVHKAPVRAIKDIVQARKGPTMEPEWCCEFECFVASCKPKEISK